MENKREVYGLSKGAKDKKLLVYIPEDQMHIALPSTWIDKAPINSVIRLYYTKGKYKNATLYNSYSTVDGIIIEDRNESYLVSVQAQSGSSISIIVPKNLFAIDNVSSLVGTEVTLYKSESGKIWNATIKERPEEPQPQILENPPNSSEEYPTTVGKTRITLYHLKSEFAYNSKMLDFIDTLGTEYAAFRRSRGDGNCYYRAVGISYIEYLCRPTTNLSAFERFMQKLERREGIFREIPGFSRRKELLKLLEYLYSCKKANAFSAIKECQNIFQDISDDETIVREMRAIASLYLVDNATNPKLSGFLVDEEVGYGNTQSLYMKMMKMGEEAEGVAFICMSEALQINIHHIFLGRDVLDFHNFEPEGNINSDVYLLLKPGHYDLLYTHKQIQDDRYDLQTSQFLPQGAQSSSNNHQVQGVSEDYVARLLVHVQYLYENLHHLSLNNKLHTKDLLPDFGSRISAFWSDYSSLSNSSYNPSKILNEAEKNLKNLVYSPNFIYQLLEICFYCLDKKSDIRLKCGHLYCSDDITDIIGQQTGGMFLLSDFEKTTPITCQLCTQVISEDEIKTALGDTWQDYDMMREERKKNYQNRLDRELGIVICPRCEQRRKKEEFKSRHKCMCDSCIKDIVKQTKTCPICEDEIMIEEILGIAKPYCGYCQELITEFSLIKCKTHWMCSNCESISFLSQSCVFCNRKFTKKEYELISARYKLICDICNDSFNQEDLKESLCNCKICKGCFKLCVDENGSVCKRCMRLVEEVDFAIFQKFDDPPLPPPKKQCAVCMDEFLRSEMLTLSCDHYFCKPCLVGYIENEINQGKIENGIKCPIDGCAELVDGSIMLDILTPEKWDQYNKIAIKKQYKITECLKCKYEFEADQKNVRCPQCKVQFCSACLKEQHPGSCEENIIKEIIIDLEKNGQPASQCPGCKYPYLKDEGCEHVKCLQPKCGVEFCFKCSCIRAPTLVHGNHYHRPECDFYAEFTGEDVYSPDKCTECKKLNKCCPRPQRLKIPRRFDEGEA